MRHPIVVLLALLGALGAVWIVSGGDPLSLLEGGSRDAGEQGGEGDLTAGGEGAAAAEAGAGGRGPRLSGLEGARRLGLGAVRGRVLDVRTGKGVDKASLLLSGKGHGGTVVAMSAESAADGTFALLEVPSGDAYALRVEAAGVGGRSLAGVGVPAGGVNDLGDLWLGHAGTIEGTVLDAAGQPVAHALVQLHRGASSMREFLLSGGFMDLFRNLDRVPEAQAEQSSGPQGAFRFEGVSPGTHSLLVRAPGFRQMIVPVTLAGDGGTQRVTVRLPAGGTISGHVFDAAGRALPGVTVVAMSEEDRMLSPLARSFATTAADGAFRVEGLMGEGRHMLVGAAPGYPNAFSHAEADATDVRLVMKRGATLELVLLVDQGGTPIAGAEVLAAVGATQNMGEGPEALVGGVTDATGSVVLEACPGELQMLFVTHAERPSSFWAAQGGARAPGMLAAPDDTRVREGRNRLVFRAPQGITIVGRVLDMDGGALAGAEVTTFSFMGGSAKAVSGSDGAYRLGADPLMAGGVQVRLTGWVQEKIETPAGEPSEETTPGAERRVDVRMRRAAAVSGRVFTPDGAPLAGATVTVRVEVKEGEPRFDPSGMFTTAPSSLTLGDGSYLVEGVPAGRSVRVVGRREGYVDAATDRVKVAEGGVTAAPDLRLLAGAALRVRALGPTGERVAGARVRLDVERDDGVTRGDFESLMEDAEGGTEVRTGADGEVTIPLVPPGKVTLRASAAGHAPAGTRLEVKPEGGPAEPVVVRLPEGIVLTGRVLDAEGRPLADVSLQVLDAEHPAEQGEQDVVSEWDASRKGRTDPEGAWRVADLPSRGLRVRAAKDGYRTVVVDAAGRREGIEIVLPARSPADKARLAELDQELGKLYMKLQDKGVDRQALMQQIQALQQERAGLVGGDE